MATRSKRFLLGVASGYGLMIVNIAYTILSIPMALHYLGKEEFGMWALAQQLAGYLMLLDFGISSALSRFLADHKDNVNGGEYGSLLLTGGLVFLVQGAMIGAIGSLFSLFAPMLFSIPAHLSQPFSHLLILLAIFYGTNIALRSIGAPLWAFQRLDVLNGIGAMGLLISLGMLWLGFLLGWGIYSLAFAITPGILLGAVLAAAVGSRRGYYPSSGHWGRPRLHLFKGIFGFGKDAVLMSLGSQLVNASQIMLISRLLGLDSAATFSVATKFSTMGQQFVAKIQESSAPGLTEMFVRGEKERFVRRFWDMIAMTTTFAAAGAAALAVANRGIVEIWTRGTIHWTATGDLLLAVLLILTANSRCFVGVFGLARDLRPVRHIYLLEGLAFIPIALVLVRFWQINGILVASIISQLGVTTLLSVRTAKPLLGNISLTIRLYVTPILLCIFLEVASFYLLPSRTGVLAVLCQIAIAGAVALFVALQFIIPNRLREDITKRVMRYLFNNLTAI